jgi:hypothetical protein
MCVKHSLRQIIKQYSCLLFKPLKQIEKILVALCFRADCKDTRQVLPEFSTGNVFPPNRPVRGKNSCERLYAGIRESRVMERKHGEGKNIMEFQVHEFSVRIFYKVW